jgi:hypothetical protein
VQAAADFLCVSHFSNCASTGRVDACPLQRLLNVLEMLYSRLSAARPATRCRRRFGVSRRSTRARTCLGEGATCIASHLAAFTGGGGGRINSVLVLNSVLNSEQSLFELTTANRLS